MSDRVFTSAIILSVAMFSWASGWEMGKNANDRERDEKEREDWDMLKKLYDESMDHRATLMKRLEECEKK